VADPKILEKGVGGRQFISSVVIYRKCAQRNIRILHGKTAFFEKNMSQWEGGRPHRPLGSTTDVNSTQQNPKPSRENCGPRRFRERYTLTPSSGGDALIIMRDLDMHIA